MRPDSYKRNLKPWMPSLLAFAALLTASSPVLGQQSLYEERCAGCHTIGGGDVVGPDLAPCKDWKIDKIRSEVKRMESMAGDLTDEEVASLATYLKKGGQGEAAGEATGEAAAAAPATEKAEASVISTETLPDTGSADNGRALFFGTRKLANGGMSCVACHQANSGGGNLGPDLAQSASKFKGPALVAACRSASFKVMRRAYKNHPITQQEGLDLATYITSTTEAVKQKGMPIHAIGSSLALIILVVIGICYRGSTKGIREKLVRRR